MRAAQCTLQLAIALAILSWVNAAQAQRGPGGGCQGGSMGTPTMGTPTIGTSTTTTGIVPVYPYYGGSSTASSYYQQSQLAYQMAMQLEYLRQQQAYAKQLEDQAAAAEAARLHKVSLRQQRRQELAARRAAAKARRLAQTRDRQRLVATTANRSTIGQLAANDR